MFLLTPRCSVLAFLMLWAFPTFAETKPVELFTIDYPPYSIVNDHSQISGIDVDVVIAAFASVGVEVVFSTAPWKRIRKNLEHGYIAGYTSCARRPEREAYIFYSDKVSEANQVAVMSVEADGSKLFNLMDLQHYKVTAVDSWSVQKELAIKGIEHVKASDIDSGIRSVVFRDIDILYNGELSTLYRAQQLNLQDKIKIKRLADKQGSAFYLCLSKHYPDNAELLNKFNTGLERIKASGKFDAIYDKYL
ncbi:transporter substrate-binding domain-containing protein [Neptunomonas japonica]|uniref:Polar amino acid transport system substrate-binding protein n=1 Tax=Neptunomonas japonica JAMM 1380 TaxID=1441457 RepID=A0A7R6PDE7_9GAMM|nr:transporter substrate-binding domain-containing protein [Neptunomonas japonica]BBB30459.1 polar amino acid transport system substrate-binding protein [Neptunomonas japonica JAMM 1380]